MTLSIGTRIKFGTRIFKVVACGNGYYTVEIEGSKGKYTIPCNEAIADIKSGVAEIL